MEGLTMTEGSERKDVTVDRKEGGPPKVGEKPPKVGDALEIDHCRFGFFVRKQAYLI